MKINVSDSQAGWQNYEMLIRRSELLQRIFDRILEDENGCWIWQGSTSGNGRGGGYGRISIHGQTAAVHRVVATHFYGYIPAKIHVDHTCRNRLCCRPDHLEVVTHLENQKRKFKDVT